MIDQRLCDCFSNYPSICEMRFIHLQFDVNEYINDMVRYRL